MKLKPCPFCGSDDLYWRVETSTNEANIGTRNIIIKCNDCGGAMWYLSSAVGCIEDDRAHAISKWNRRVNSTSSNTALRDLQKKYDEAVNLAQDLQEKYNEAVKLLQDIGEAFTNEQNANGQLISRKISIWDFLEELDKNKEELK